jgi:hypothetical protein
MYGLYLQAQMLAIARLIAGELNVRLKPKNITLAITDAALGYAVAQATAAAGEEEHSPCHDLSCTFAMLDAALSHLLLGRRSLWTFAGAHMPVAAACKLCRQSRLWMHSE